MMAAPRPAQSMVTRPSPMPAAAVIPPRQPTVPAPAASGSVSGTFGWTTLDGRVILVEPIYLAKPDFHWGRFLTKLLLLGSAVYFLGFLILIALGALLILAWLLHFLLPGGMLSGIAVQLISFMLTRRLMGPMANVPVRDFRLRDSSGQEHLVRLKGQLLAGSIAVGDEVIAEGWNRSGMLLLRRGFNKRLGAALKIKPE